MSTKKHIILKLKKSDSDEEYIEETDKASEFFPYVRFRDHDLVDKVENGDEVIYQGDYIIINVEERYRYEPIHVKVYLTPTEVKSNVPKSVNYFKFKDEEQFHKYRDELGKLCGRDVFEDIYPLWKAYHEKMRKLYFESFKDSCFVSKRVINEYKKHKGLTIRSLLQILKHLITTIYPDDIMGDRGVSCSLELENNTISYNMD